MTVQTVSSIQNYLVSHRDVSIRAEAKSLSRVLGLSCPRPLPEPTLKDDFSV